MGVSPAEQTVQTSVDTVPHSSRGGLASNPDAQVEDVRQGGTGAANLALVVRTLLPVGAQPSRSDTTVAR